MSLELFLSSNTVEEQAKILLANPEIYQRYEDIRLFIQKRMQDHFYDKVSFKEALSITRIVNNSKVTSRYWERWVANTIGGKATSKNPIDSTDPQDYGDILMPPMILGEDNAELKVSEKNDTGVGCQQARFYENIPWYIFMRFINNEPDIYLLHKWDLYQEIFAHGMNCGLSQSSGKLKRKTRIQRFQMIKETFQNKNTNLYGLGFTCKQKKIIGKLGKATGNKEPGIEIYERWTDKYKVTIDELKDWPEIKRTRTVSTPNDLHQPVISV